MSTATSPMGLKRICTSCGVRFYDMNNRPIICPSCGTEFTGEVKVKTRRGRAAAADTPKKDEAIKAVATETEEDIIEDEDDGVEVVSLDDAEDNTTEEDNTVLGDEDNLDDIPDIEIDDDLGGDDDTLLDEDDD